MIGRMVAPDDLRGLMRHWPHGVSVLTVDYEGDRMGVTVSSLVSLSLDPPLVGVSIGKEASCYELLRRSGAWAVSLLGGDQAELAAPDWHPRLLDYIYVSFTNSIAFSPTDSMPLTRRAKALMLSESAVSALSILLVAARAVNIFK